MGRRRASQTTNDIVWDGRALWWPRYKGGVVPGGDSSLWMCAQDVGTEIWAHFHRLETRYGRYQSEPLRLEACSDELRNILIESLPYNQYGKSLSGAVMEFVRMVAQQFVIDGFTPFEVRGGWDRSGETPRLEGARVDYVYPDSMLKLGPWLFQIVPPDATDEGADTRVVRLDSRRIVTFKPPRCYRSTLARMRSGFLLIGRSEHGWRESWIGQKAQEDFKAVTRSYRVRRARLSAPIGWDGRGLFSDHIAGFHGAYRQLQWHRFCIEVRDAILTTLASVFAMIGAWRGENPHLVWEHLPTIKQVRAGESELMGKGTRFDEVLKPFSLLAEPIPGADLSS